MTLNFQVASTFRVFEDSGKISPKYYINIDISSAHHQTEQCVYYLYLVSCRHCLSHLYSVSDRQFYVLTHVAKNDYLGKHPYMAEGICLVGRKRNMRGIMLNLRECE
jgi:hypothetical protein